MTTQTKLIAFSTLGFVLILLAMYLDFLGTYWRGLMLLSGGWFMAVGVWYQMKIYAQQKDIAYYVLLIFTGVFWLSMLVLTLFWLSKAGGFV